MTEAIPRAEPLREAVYARVVDLITCGEYPPGTPLSEAALSRALDVSRTPVREALLRLQAEGVVQSTLARGFTVRPLTREEASELYPILAALEALAVGTITTVPQSTITEMVGLLTELADCADPVRRWRLDTAWHNTLVAASGNHRLAHLAAQLRTNVSRYELSYMRTVRSRQHADHQHREILALVAAGQSQQGAALMTRHWHDGLQHLLGLLPPPQDTNHRGT